jgi:N-acetylmuramoyl-L-alanine amidase
MVAVGWVVLNRQKNASFPDTVCAVVRDGGEKAPCQFSYWCDGEPDVPRQNQSWNLANKIAAEMLTDPPADPTRGALYYHSTDTSPSWADAHRRTAKVGQLIFYR